MADLHSDAELYAIASELSPPPYVKAASAGQLRGDSNLDPAHHADPILREYPLHTAAATWLAAAGLARKEASSGPADPMIAAAIDRAAAFWGIAGDVAAVRAKVAALAATPGDDLAGLTDEAFAHVGESGRRLPMRHAGEVKAAAAYFARHRDAFDFAGRHAMALRVLKRAAALGVDLGDDAAPLDRAAGLGLSIREHAAAAANQRLMILEGRGSKLAAAARPLRDVLADPDLDWADPGVRMKAAAALDGLDRAAGLARDYAGGLPRPEEAAFGLTEGDLRGYKAARVATPGGAVYAREDLATLKAAALRDELGDDFAGRVAPDGLLDLEKLAAALPGMDKAAAAAFDRAALRLGVTPAVAPAATSGVPWPTWPRRWGFSRRRRRPGAARRRAAPGCPSATRPRRSGSRPAPPSRAGRPGGGWRGPSGRRSAAATRRAGSPAGSPRRESGACRWRPPRRRGPPGGRGRPGRSARRR